MGCGHITATLQFFSHSDLQIWSFECPGIFSPSKKYLQASRFSKKDYMDVGPEMEKEIINFKRIIQDYFDKYISWINLKNDGNGPSGNWTRGLYHAKVAIYHWSTGPPYNVVCVDINMFLLIALSGYVLPLSVYLHFRWNMCDDHS